jgi:hypothetical protein
MIAGAAVPQDEPGQVPAFWTRYLVTQELQLTVRTPEISVGGPSVIGLPHSAAVFVPAGVSLFASATCSARRVSEPRRSMALTLVRSVRRLPMPSAATRVRIFLASPGDVVAERDQVAKVVQELNTTLSALAPDQGIVLELIRWESHVHPGLGTDAQDVVNQQIDDYDIFVGVMWRRFGTPTSRAESGTEEEFRIAHRAWRDRRRLLQILFYFCQAPSAPPSQAEEVAQLGRVVAFRQELTSQGLVWEYDDHAAFADTIRPHLVMVLGRLVHEGRAPTDERLVTPSPTGAARLPDADLAVVQRQVSELADEYERIRSTMIPGDARTRRMEVVASRMRTLALSTTPLLEELTTSRSPGMRLAAVSTLQAIPNTRFLPWLAERIEQEKPFVGYHAALALLSAARTVELSALATVEAAVQRARSARVRRDTDRDITLGHVEDELRRRRSEGRL